MPRISDYDALTPVQITGDEVIVLSKTGTTYKINLLDLITNVISNNVTDEVPDIDGTTSGKFLSNDGVTTSWDEVPTELPTIDGSTTGKVLTNDGVIPSWDVISGLPEQPAPPASAYLQELEVIGGPNSEELGYSVGVSGDGTTIAIGGRTYDDGVIGNPGRVVIYKKISGVWTNIGEILGIQSFQRFGHSVALSTDGTRLVVGSYQYQNGVDTEAGLVNVYDYDGNNWNALGTPIAGIETQEYFGYSVDISGDGTAIVVGSTGYDGGDINIGRVVVYDYGADWVARGSGFVGATSGYQIGETVSISSDGATIAFTGKGDFNTGFAQIHTWSGSAWSQVGLTINGENGFDTLSTVSLSSDGSRVAVGALQYPSASANGQVRVFDDVAGTWTQVGTSIVGPSPGSYYGAAISLSGDGNTLVMGSQSYGGFDGICVLFSYSGGDWVVTDTKNGLTDENLGVSVSTSDNGLVFGVGADAYDDDGFNEGRALIFGKAQANYILASIDGVLSWLEV